MWIHELTLGPFGPSLTAQTADPCTRQCEHLHVVLSLKTATLALDIFDEEHRKDGPFVKTAGSSTAISSVANIWSRPSYRT